MQTLLSSMRKAIKHYGMIREGDRVAVGLSGGKDSMTMLTLLANYRRFSPEKFDIVAITLNPGDVDFEPVRAYCAELDVPFVEVKTNLFEILFDIRKESNPCSLCAKMRRGKLIDAARQNGCNVVALGHHLDDVVETLLLNLYYTGRYGAFYPVTYLNQSDVHVIRPLLYVEEKDVRRFVRNQGFPIVPNPCPVDGYTKRAEMKAHIEAMEKTIPNFKSNLFHSLVVSDSIMPWPAPEK
ncbi:MAG: tRNA 2-thiocytidine biosynthesis TtcA family protein [Bacilli bacterium]